MKEVLTPMDGNTAAAHVAYKTNEVIAIYPITPASPMGELSDQWSVANMKNIWGSVPKVIEMQSEGGAAGAVHGALQAGALTTTFTASQGLLLMLPNMFKIAGELTPTVFHIAARSVASSALSIFGDHSDVMAVRSAGWAQLYANSVQEAMDMSMIAHASTLTSSIPFLHIFDGFRTSHEIQNINVISDEIIKKMIQPEWIHKQRTRSMNPNKPFIRGTAQNPDTFFQTRERVNPFYDDLPLIVQSQMDKLAKLTGRAYKLFDYLGHPEAEKVIIMMGSGAEAAEETVNFLVAKGEKVGLVKVRLYRPFSAEHLLASLPKSVKAISVLDRTKEPGANGEPLYQDVAAAITESLLNGEAILSDIPKLNAGRYGLSSKEFTPAMVQSVYNNMLAENGKKRFTVGINDDVTTLSLPAINGMEETIPAGTKSAIFWGLGSDGTVGANKNTIKILTEATGQYGQGYFVYDSKKSGAMTVSHLRFGPHPIKSTYLVDKADFVGVHQFGFFNKYHVLDSAREGANLLINSPFKADELFEQLPESVQKQIIEKKLNVYNINALEVSKEAGLGARINTVMQTCYFALSGVLPKDEAIKMIKDSIQKTYGKRGQSIVTMNFKAVDAASGYLYEVKIPEKSTANEKLVGTKIHDSAPDFVKDVTAMIMANRGDELPVSALPMDGTFPSGTTKWEKRNIATEVPEWDPDVCIQCGKCVMVCPHATIRAKAAAESCFADAPAAFKIADAKGKELKGLKYTLQVAVEDCTGCKLCVEVCPVKDRSNTSRKAINMVPQLPIRERERENWAFFEQLPEMNTYPSDVNLANNHVKDVQFLEPLFEFSGACAGCGETPYLKLLSQLYGDRALIANATGCSSIYGGNLPTTPWTVNKKGRGPAWNNSLFEDNAEFGLGMRMAADKKQAYAKELLVELKDELDASAVAQILSNKLESPEAIAQQRVLLESIEAPLKRLTNPKAADLVELLDELSGRSVWIVGGDGWAYDIGYGGLDHVVASSANVNILVLDTEVYSNTGGQASKATSLGSIAKFAAGGKPTPKKDLGKMIMSYGSAYVAQIAMGANENQVIKAFKEAESFDGPSLIIAYSHCIAHGIDMAKGMEQQKLAVETGHWPIYRFDPRLSQQDKPALQLDCRAPKRPLQEYIYNENRYAMLERQNPEVAHKFLKMAQAFINKRWAEYEIMAGKAKK
jgi:pyruvate-ferredoxin/flavodoxin oxidoreductase